MRRPLPLLALTFVLSACNLVKTTPTNPTPNPASTTVSYTAVGASDAIGYGSSSLCLPFAACPDGKGYVQLLTRRMTSDGKTVTLNNLGLPGGVLSPEIQGIGNAIGRDILSNFIENEMPFVTSGSTLVTVFAGGNDVNTIGAAIEAGQAGSSIPAYILGRRQAFGRDLRTLLAGIRSRAPDARIVWLNLANLAALPYAASYPLQKKRTLQDVSVAFSAEVNALRADGAIIIDIMCDPAFYQAGNYSSDGFHPNDAGYAHLTDLAYAPATTGQGTAPQPTCSLMTQF